MWSDGMKGGTKNRKYPMSGLFAGFILNYFLLASRRYSTHKTKQRFENRINERVASELL